MFAVTANKSVIASLVERSDVKELSANKKFKANLERIDYPVNTNPENEPFEPSVRADPAEWNLDWVKAPLVWDKGIKGNGFTVANADTGVQHIHPALVKNYRGTISQGQYDHNYNWWDAIHETGSSCGASSRVPCDDNGHGTHTTGTACGDGSERPNRQRIGVAPDAKWIGCRNMNAGYGTPQTYIECLQFFIAPHDLNGANPKPELRPHVIGNSYGCPPSEGCTSQGVLQEAVDNVINAGIFMSVSAGNSGPSCSTARDPPSFYPNVFSVGALGARTNNIASYSSRGPIFYLTIQQQLPNMVAPGSSVVSCMPGNRYQALSGTSMASPHITGIIPLLWEAIPSISRNINATRDLLQKTSLRIPNSQCGGTGDHNNVYGFGAVNVLAAVESGQKMFKN